MKKTKVVLISLYNRDMAFGVRSLSSVLNRSGHHCDIIFFKQMTTGSDPSQCLEINPNSNFYTPYTDVEIDLLINKIKEISPQLIGLSVISSFFNLAGVITGKIKKEMGVPVIWGGIHPTISPEESINSADIICVGEGEGAVLDLADAIHEGKDFTHIKNLWLTKTTGEIFRNELRPVITELDALGFPDNDSSQKFYIDFDQCRDIPFEADEHFGDTYNLMTSRGCPYNCTYCCNQILNKIYHGKGPRIRRRSPQSIIDEILHMLKLNYKFSYIHFWDDVFTFDKEWINEFSRLYAQKIALPFTCYAHPEYTDNEILKKLKSAGLFSVNLGIQTGSEATSLELYKRQTNRQKIIEAASSLKDLGIFPWYDLIVDNPYENENDYRSTLELMLSLPQPFEANLHSLCFFPGTQLTEKALADGLISQSEVEGKNTKAVDHFRMSLDKTRSTSALFWIILLGMTKHQFFPRWLIAWISRNRMLHRYPGILRLFVVTILKIKKREMMRRVEKDNARKKLGISQSQSEMLTGSILNKIVIENRTEVNHEILLGLRIYPVTNPHYPERYLGAWNVPLIIPPEGLNLMVKMTFPAVSFLARDDSIEPENFWIGDIREAGLYCIESVLYHNNNEVVDNHIMHCHSYNIF